MQVSDVMERHIVTVTPTTSLQDIGKIIFGLHIVGVPVVKGRKLVGYVTQTDILRKLYPTYQDFIEDYVHAKDFEAMEELTEKVFQLTAKDIMNRDVITVYPDTPIMKVQSIMLVKGFGRVPIVDKKGNLLGVVSQADIFRAIVGQKLPFEKDEVFHDWMSRYFPLLQDWKLRLGKEVPDLTKLFRKQGAKKVLDVGCGLGLHAIALAKEGFDVVGIERSARMIYTANRKAQKLPESVKKRTYFICHEYENLEKITGDGFDAAMFLGIGLTHNRNPLKVLQEVEKVLTGKAVIVIQLANFEKVIKVNKRLVDFEIRPSSETYQREHAFLRFYDPKEDGLVNYNVAVFDRGTKQWGFRGMNSTPLVPLDKEKTTALLRKIGFSKISYFGGDGGFYYDYLFRKPFKKDTSDQLIIVARR